VTGAKSLAERLVEAEKGRDDAVAQCNYYRSLVQAFFTGEPPKLGGDFDHFILATWGRKRFESMTPVPAILKSN
jgi:hypothetical protein